MFLSFELFKFLKLIERLEFNRRKKIQANTFPFEYEKWRVYV